MREEQQGLRQLRVTVSQLVARWSEAWLFLPHRCRRAGVGYRLTRAGPLLRRPRRRPVPRGGLRTGRPVLADATGDRGADALRARPAGLARLAADPRLRHRLLLHGHGLDAVRRHRRLAGDVRPGGGVLRPARPGPRAVHAAPLVAALVSAVVGRHRDVAQRLAVLGHAVRPPRLRDRRHALGGGAALDRDDRRQPAGRPDRYDARLAGARGPVAPPQRRAGRGRPGCRDPAARGGESRPRHGG